MQRRVDPLRNALVAKAQAQKNKAVINPVRDRTQQAITLLLNKIADDNFDRVMS